ncbi:putative phage holin [Streptomyces sp. 900105245]
MTADQWVNAAASTAAATACAGFAVTYHWRVTWWRSQMGQNLMAFAVSVGLLCAYTVLVSLWPSGWPATVLRGVSTAVGLAIAVLMVQRTRLFLREQRAHRRPPGA